MLTNAIKHVTHLQDIQSQFQKNLKTIEQLIHAVISCCDKIHFLKNNFIEQNYNLILNVTSTLNKNK